MKFSDIYVDVTETLLELEVPDPPPPELEGMVSHDLLTMSYI